MVKFETLKEGDILYDCHRHKLGNTTMSELGVWTVKVISVDHSNMSAIVSWNGNAPKTWYANRLGKLRRYPPEWVKRAFGDDKCVMCGWRRVEGHAPYCDHPKAVSARKKEAKGNKQ